MKRNSILSFFKSSLYTVLFSLTTFQVYSQDTITLITHNVLAFSGHPKEIFITDTSILQNAISFYESMDADILVLQESPPEKYIRILADSLDYNYSFFNTKEDGDSIYPYGFPGCILTKYPILQTFDFTIDLVNIPDTIFSRSSGEVILSTPIGLIQVTGLHLCADWGKRFRETTRVKELDLLLKNLQQCESCIASFVVGDFNSRPLSNPYNKMINGGFIDTHADLNTPTVPVPDSRYRIDYIFLKENSKISYFNETLSVPYYTELKLFLSDHQPCLIKFYKK